VRRIGEEVGENARGESLEGGIDQFVTTEIARRSRGIAREIELRDRGDRA
jgi:hypothetical protein